MYSPLFSNTSWTREGGGALKRPRQSLTLRNFLMGETGIQITKRQCVEC